MINMLHRNKIIRYTVNESIIHPALSKIAIYQLSSVHFVAN